MKKIITLLLVLIMMFALCGCGNTKSDTQTQPVVLVPAAATEKPTEKADFDENGFGEKELEEPVVLLDCSSVKVTAMSVFKEDKFYYPENFVVGYRVLIENKSDKFLNIGLSDTSVDGFMVYAYAEQTQVSPDKKAMGILYVQKMDLPTLETVEDFVNFEGTLTVYSNDVGNTYTYTGTGESSTFCIP